MIQPISPAQTWPIRHLVMWPNQPLEYVMLEEDQHGEHFGLFQNDQLVSIVSVFTEGKEAQFRKFATLQRYQGQGLGTQLLSYVFDEMQNRSISRIWCNARSEKAGFYARFGMRQTDATFQKGGLDYVIMDRYFTV